MAKVINIRKPYIDIVFKDDDGAVVAEFKFDKTDDANQRILDVQNGILKSLGKAENDPNYTFDKLKEELRKALDSLIGEGAFDQLYELSGSWEIMLHYFVEICVAISEETHSNLNEMNAAIAKYAGH